MHWIKQNARLLLCAALALLLGLGTGVLLPNRRQAAQEPELVAEPVGSASKPSILPDTAVQVEYEFLLCGHAIERDESGGALTGRSAEQIRALWPDARIVAMEREYAEIRREVSGYCPAHFVLYADAAGALCISSTSNEDLLHESVQTLDYDATALPEEVQAQLAAGMVFESLEQINAYLEDVES